jgi:hypothetical protein
MEKQYCGVLLRHLTARPMRSLRVIFSEFEARILPALGEPLSDPCSRGSAGEGA